jgi:hypothetical protein
MDISSLKVCHLTNIAWLFAILVVASPSASVAQSDTPEREQGHTVTACDEDWQANQYSCDTLVSAGYAGFVKSLAESGIAFQNNLTQFYMGNTAGGVELFYNAAVNSMLTITPDLQVLSSARENLDTALVAGLCMNLAF